MPSYGRKLKDITEHFTIAAKQLQPGELVKDDYFTLFEAVGALEIMDPKMDSGFVPPNDTFEADFDPSTSLTANEVIWIMDQLLCLEITWLDGYPLSQTVFTSLHVDRLLSPEKRNYNTFYNDDDPSSTEPPTSAGDILVHKVLRAYCIALIKSCQLALYLIQSQAYSEEEDFVSHLFGRDLLPEIGSNAALEMLKEAMAWLEETDLPHDISTALLVRCRFRQRLIDTLTADDPQWGLLWGVLDRIKESQPLGVPVPDAFSEKVQRQLATSTPPRPMVQISFDAAFPIWTALCQDIMLAYELTSPVVITSPHCLQRAVWAFAYTRQPLTLARAQMQELLFADNAVRRHQMPHFDLLLADMTDLVLAGDPLVDPESFQVEAPNDPRHKCSNLLRAFMEKVVDEYLNLYRFVCQNRCRTRRAFTQLVAVWDAVQKEAEEVDQDLLQYSTTLQHTEFARGHGPLRTWASYHTLQILSWTVQLGFETDLYLPDELGKMYWHLAAFSASRIELLNGMLDVARERIRKSSRDGRKVAECTSSRDFLASLVDAAQATRSLADALWKFYYLLARVGIIKAPKRDFAQRDLLYEARMKPYISLPHGYVDPDIPSPAGFEDEICDLEKTVFRSFASTSEAVEGDIKAAKTRLANLKRYSPEQGKFVGTAAEWIKEIKMMETTCVALAVGLSQLKRLRDKFAGGGADGERRLGERVGVVCEKKYHDWWVLPQLREKEVKG